MINSKTLLGFSPGKNIKWTVWVPSNRRGHTFFTISSFTTVIMHLTGKCLLWNIHSTAMWPIYGIVWKNGRGRTFFFYYFSLFYLYFTLRRAVLIMKNAQHSHPINLKYCTVKSERSYIFFTILGCTTVITCLTGNCPLWKMLSTATRPIWGTVQKNRRGRTF